MKKIMTLVMCVLTLSFIAQAQEKTTGQKNKTEVKTAQKLTADDYEELFAKLQKGDTNIDFVKMRFAYAETKNYSPYGVDAGERKAMFDDFNGKKYEAALKKAGEILKTNYVEMNSHYISMVSHRELGNSEKSEFHKKVFAGLINSIVGGADGKTAKTAYKVISVPEEYVVINFLGLRRMQQAVIVEDGSRFDILTVGNDETKETQKLYFNIDTVWKGYEKIFSK